MAKKRKNSNYVTEKTERRRLEEEKLLKRKKIKKTMLISLAVFLAVAVLVLAVLGLCYVSGAFDYHPEATHHAEIEILNYGTLHVALYGNDAPETVNKFLELVDSGDYVGLTLFQILGDSIYGGTTYAGISAGIRGEFSDNGVNNKVSHTRGTISMARGEDYNSAYSQFFIVREDSPEFDGKYAAFARITSGMDIIDHIFESVHTYDDGKIPLGEQPAIKKIEIHSASAH